MNKKIKLKPVDVGRYVLSERRDYVILQKIYQLESGKLSRPDKEVVKLISTQLEHDWRKPLIKYLDYLLKKYII